MLISELISSLASSTDRDVTKQVEARFPDSTFGLLMHGLPNTDQRQKIVVGAPNRPTMGFVSGPNGRKMIKACADPDLFDANYPGSINVTMSGKELLEMAGKIQEADGILVCSATSFHSYPIYKAAYPKLRLAKQGTGLRKWWQFWNSAK